MDGDLCERWSTSQIDPTFHPRGLCPVCHKLPNGFAEAVSTLCENCNAISARAALTGVIKSNHDRSIAP